MIFGAHACGIPTCLGVVIVKEMGVCFSIPFITFLLALIIYYVCTLMCLFTSTFNTSSFLLIKKMLNHCIYICINSLVAFQN